MHSDPYRTFVKSLNATAPYYPFGEMRSLVMNHDARRRSAFAAFFRYATGVALLATLAVGFSGHFLTNETSQSSDVSRVTLRSHQTDNAIATHSATNAGKHISLAKKTIENTDEKSALAEHQDASANRENVSSTNAAPRNSTMEKTSQSSGTETAQSPIAQSNVSSTTLSQLSDRTEATIHAWSAFASGGTSLLNTNFTMGSLFGAAGVRYRLGGSSSVVVELRRSSFIVNHAGQTGGFRDTMVTVGGQTTPLTIGGLTQTAAAVTTSVNSLDLGYRYDLNPNNTLSPCAEILTGASTSGLLASEAVGIEYRLTNSLLFDLSARAEQLFSPSSVPLNALGFEAGLGFEW